MRLENFAQKIVLNFPSLKPQNSQACKYDKLCHFASNPKYLEPSEPAAKLAAKIHENYVKNTYGLK